MSGLLPWENARAWGKMKRLKAENAHLKAEVKRLTKAGDTMANVLCFCLGLGGEEPRFVKDWNAAKEGKPSV